MTQLYSYMLSMPRTVEVGAALAGPPAELQPLVVGAPLPVLSVCVCVCACVCVCVFARAHARVNARACFCVRAYGWACAHVRHGGQAGPTPGKLGLRWKRGLRGKKIRAAKKIRAGNKDPHGEKVRAG